MERADEKLAVISDLETSRWNLAGLVGGSRQAMSDRIAVIAGVNLFMKQADLNVIGQKMAGH